MGWRIGDLGIGLIILSLVITSFTFLLLSFDVSIGKSTSLTTDLTELDSIVENVSTLTSQSSAQVDNLTSFTIEQNQLLETRSASEAGVFNLFSKNILINYLRLVGEKLGLKGFVITAGISLLITIVTILVTRFFFGSSRV